jgi:hypothetical protein
MDNKELFESVWRDVQRTVGYNESDNRAELKKGVQLAIDKAYPHFKQIKGTCTHIKDQNTTLRKDLTTISDTILKYSSFDD